MFTCGSHATFTMDASARPFAKKKKKAMVTSPATHPAIQTGRKDSTQTQEILNYLGT